MVSVIYVDTSAAMKLLVDEPESNPLVAALTGGDYSLAASWLLHAELHCAAGRHPSVVTLAAVTTVLDAITLIDLSRGDLMSAGTHAPLCSHDAIHLAVAMRIGADGIVTYDEELAQAALAAGVEVLAPR